MRIELLWFDGCPNHEHTRVLLERVLASRGIDASAVQTIVVDETSTDTVKFPGSPTLRVDGRDVEPGFKDSGDYALNCRVYQTPEGLQGFPAIAWIERAIDEAMSRHR